jgi:hypothetical protein
MNQTNQITRGAEMLARISVAADGDVWGIESSGAVLRYQQASQTWQSVLGPGSKGLSHLSVGSRTQIWGLDPDGEVYQYTGGETGWQKIPGTLTWISAAADGTVCGVDTAGMVYRYVGEPSLWQPMPGTLLQISVGSAEHIWGIDTAGNALRYEQRSQSWQEIPGQFTSISVGADGAVWGSDRSGNTFLYAGEPLVWLQAAFRVKQFSAGSFTFAWGIDYDGHAVDLIDRGITEAQVNWVPTDDVTDPLRETGFWQIDENARYDDTKNTHLWIVLRAARLAAQDPVVGHLLTAAIRPEAKDIPDAIFHNALCQGLYDGDYKKEFNNSKTYVSHFYDPDTGCNYMGVKDPSALTQGRTYFKQARDAYLANHIQDAGYYLGVSLHYMTDLTQPMHAANYTWLHFPIGFHTLWEEYAQTLLNQVMPPDHYSPLDLGTMPDPYLRAAARRAKDTFLTLALFKALKTAPPPTVPPSNWQESTRQDIAKILRPAIQVASQYLVAWFRSLDNTLKWDSWSGFSTSQVVTSPGAPVTAVWRPPLHRDLFVTDNKGRVWSMPWEPGTRSYPWSPLNPGEDVQAAPGAPITAVWRPRYPGVNGLHLDLFATDSQGNVRSTVWEPSVGWQPWFPIHPDGAPQATPGASVTAVWSPGRFHLDLFVADNEGNVRSTFWEPSAGWQPWFSVPPGEDFTAAPGAPVTALWHPSGPAHLDLFVADSQGRVWSTFWEQSARWQPWFLISPGEGIQVAPGAPITAAWRPGGRGIDGLHLDLFATDSEGRVRSTFWELAIKWQPWFSVSAGGDFTATPGAPITASWRPFDILHLNLFVTDRNGRVKSTFHEPATGWQPWFTISPGGGFSATPGAPVTATWFPGRLHLDLFVTSKDGSIWGTSGKN